MITLSLKTFWIFLKFEVDCLGADLEIDLADTIIVLVLSFFFVAFVSSEHGTPELNLVSDVNNDTTPWCTL